jgi:hypothetical protein
MEKAVDYVFLREGGAELRLALEEVEELIRLSESLSISQVLEDLDALEKEFEDVEFFLKTPMLDEYFLVQVVTPPVLLKGVNLGKFVVSMDSNLAVEAFSAAPQYSNDSNHSDYFHPHVDPDGGVCLGNAYKSFRFALFSGRLFDCFDIVYRVLSNYNHESVYVPIETWDEDYEEIVECSSCGAPSSDTCQSCGLEVCSCCHGWCSDCRNGFCLDCLTVCGKCGKPRCSDCSSTYVCRKCHSSVCEACVASKTSMRAGEPWIVCSECFEEEEEEALEEQDPEDDPEEDSEEDSEDDSENDDLGVVFECGVCGAPSTWISGRRFKILPDGSLVSACERCVS